MAKTIPSPKTLRKLIKYRPRSGKFFWKPRDPSDFEAHSMTPECRADRWNKMYAGRRAFKTYLKGMGLTGKINQGETLRACDVAWAIHYGRRPNGKITFIDGNEKNLRIKNLAIERVDNSERAS